MQKADSSCTFAGKEREVTQLECFPLTLTLPPQFSLIILLCNMRIGKIFQNARGGKWPQCKFQQRQATLAILNKMGFNIENKEFTITQVCMAFSNDSQDNAIKGPDLGTIRNLDSGNHFTSGWFQDHLPMVPWGCREPPQMMAPRIHHLSCQPRLKHTASSAKCKWLDLTVRMLCRVLPPSPKNCFWI